MNSADYLNLDGTFDKMLEHFSPRVEQIEIASQIENCLGKGDGNLLIEAGTGTGKTLAYLLPILLSGKKAIISSGTKTLQDQLYFHEIPQIQSITGLKSRVALLKGRSNYLCPQRLSESLKILEAESDRGIAGEYSQARLLDELVRIREWSSYTSSGDIGEIEGVEEASPVWNRVTSTRDNCLGSRCPRFVECPVYKARKNAEQADVLIVNHHLLFSDLLRKEENTGQILPSAQVIVVDEAHQVPDIVRHLSGTSISSGQVFALVEDVRRAWKLLGKDDPHLFNVASQVQRAFKKLVKTLGTLGEGATAIDYRKLDRDTIDFCDNGLVELANALDVVKERSVSLVKAYDRTLELADLFATLTEVRDPENEFVHWWESRGTNLVVHLSPLGIADTMGALVNSQQHQWIFTSATLTVDDRFDYFEREIGVTDGMDTLHFKMPFDIYSSVKWYIPGTLPLPNTQSHTSSLVEECLPLIECNKGRTFFLFTSFRAMEIAASCLKEVPGITLLVQGRISKMALLEQFRRRDRSVLLATYSFWEGVDVRGCSLRLLIIDKLPFKSPSDPLVEARMRSIDMQGGDGFWDYLLPQAVVGLRQGFGRLIREESDRGLFVLGDKRVSQFGYGKVFLDSLPKMPVLESGEETLEYIKAMNDDSSKASGL